MPDYQTQLQAFTAKRSDIYRLERLANEKIQAAKVAIEELARLVIKDFIAKATPIIPGFEGFELEDYDDPNDINDYRLVIIGDAPRDIIYWDDIPDSIYGCDFNNDELAAVQDAAELLHEISGGQDTSW